MTCILNDSFAFLNSARILKFLIWNKRNIHHCRFQNLISEIKDRKENGMNISKFTQTITTQCGSHSFLHAVYRDLVVYIIRSYLTASLFLLCSEYVYVCVCVIYSLQQLLNYCYIPSTPSRYQQFLLPIFLFFLLLSLHPPHPRLHLFTSSKCLKVQTQLY